jgi:geranylgeranyl diphosphate synthase type I
VLTSTDLDALITDTETEMLRVIDAAQDVRTAELYDWVRYHMGLDGAAQRGKRLRPLLGLLAYQSIAGEHVRALPGAAAVEMGHNFSLVHDDIQDESPERRHRPALWTRIGIPQAINTGDALFTLSRMALHRLTDLGFGPQKVLDLMRLYDETCLALCEGQYLDIRNAAAVEWPGVDEYFDMIGRKTAALIAGSVQAGAMLATDDPAVIAAYRSFGWALGLAFQLNDDLLGIWGDEAATGKEPSDIEARKKTLPLIHALEVAAPADRARLRAILATPPGAEAVSEARTILDRTGSRQYTRGRARYHRDEAIAQLEAAGVVDGEAMARLRLIVASAIAA